MPRRFEALVLDRMPVIVLKYSAVPVPGRADHDVAQTEDISSRDATADTDHENEPEVGKGPRHVLGGRRGVDEPILPVWQDGNDDVVRAHLAQGVIVGITDVDVVDPPMALVEKCPGSIVLCVERTDPTDGVTLRFGHDLICVAGNIRLWCSPVSEVAGLDLRN